MKLLIFPASLKLDPLRLEDLLTSLPLTQGSRLRENTSRSCLSDLILIFLMAFSMENYNRKCLEQEKVTELMLLYHQFSHQLSILLFETQKNFNAHI